jgi:hypothetical protein
MPTELLPGGPLLLYNKRMQSLRLLFWSYLYESWGVHVGADPFGLLSHVVVYCERQFRA